MTNILTNPGFEINNPPDDWSMVNGTSITRVSTPIHGGSYSAQFIANNTNLHRRIRQSVSNPGNYGGLSLSLSAWVLTSSSGVHLRLEDNAGDTASSNHTGGGGWEYLSVTRTITASPTYIYANLGWKAPDGTLTVYLDDAFLDITAAPTVTTQDVTSIAETTATGNGNITSLGVPNPTQHGHCWNTTGTPTTADSKTQKGAASATGAFTSAMTGLVTGTQYYVRAYATNDAGTSYGGEVNFTTSTTSATFIPKVFFF